MTKTREKKDLKKEIKRVYKRIIDAADYIRTLGKNDISGRMGAMDGIEWSWYELGELSKQLKS